MSGRVLLVVEWKGCADPFAYGRMMADEIERTDVSKGTRVVQVIPLSPPLDVGFWTEARFWIERLLGVIRVGRLTPELQLEIARAFGKREGGGLRRIGSAERSPPSGQAEIQKERPQARPRSKKPKGPGGSGGSARQRRARRRAAITGGKRGWFP